MSLFGHHDPPPAREVDRDAFGDPIKVTEQTVHVTTVERDNGVRSAETNSISSALHDLADRNSTTHTVKLPHGTTIKLAASVSPSLGSWRARFEITNGSDTPKTAIGVTKAADLAKEVDVIAMSKKDKTAIQQMAEERLEEIEIHVSGYVTKKGKHVGAYSQIRKAIDKLGPGSRLHLPEGITVKKHRPGGSGPAHFEVSSPEGATAKVAGANNATSIIASRSAKSTHPKSLGGRVSRSGVDSSQKVSQLANRGDNPKLPGTPHPEDVAERAAKARKEAVKRLPSRKQRAANEELAGTKSKIAGLKDGESIQVGTSRVRRVDLEPPRTPSGRKANVKGGTTYEVTGPGGRKGTGVWTTPELAAKEAIARNVNNANPTRGRRTGSQDAITRRGRGGVGWNPDDPPEQQALDMMAGTNMPKREQWKEPYDELTKGNRSLKVEGLRAAWAHAKVSGDEKMASRIMETIKKAEGRSSKSSRLVPEKSAAANIDREKRERAKAVSGHPAARARRRFKGLEESAAPGLIGRR